MYDVTPLHLHPTLSLTTWILLLAMFFTGSLLSSAPSLRIWHVNRRLVARFCRSRRRPKMSFGSVSQKVSEFKGLEMYEKTDLVEW